jgi:ADP-ribose pyrophosphatase YjhB (NUDIX family)
MQLQVGVKILLKNKDDKYLFLERSREKYPEVKEDELLDIVGGRMELGTPLLENLKREIFEETQLTLIAEPKLIAAQDILRSDKHVIRLTYVGYTAGEPTLDEEHVAHQWLTKDEVLKTTGIDRYSREIFEKYILE